MIYVEVIYCCLRINLVKIKQHNLKLCVAIFFHPKRKSIYPLLPTLRKINRFENFPGKSYHHTISELNVHTKSTRWSKEKNVPINKEKSQSDDIWRMKFKK